jgi:hypothetical protein
MENVDHPFMDFDDFNLRKGSKVGFKSIGGKVLFGTISNIERDEVTGEVRITLE